ncbi:unnamed protein product [Rotaria sp. Silwood2]|nr:unnamed protein product [Rotaria sp. Silwood2]CAF3081363.1 unnamed protein product [Rotaria sp. Silwood2]CAF3126909.1 unnamed protein product [Rotaria sp. Silwood2]CAF3317587.1 unnamed protein product [Rotaria sp. Silwood2]CAF4207185.1 unnamed protein product [Rotaria sp. Silwood2]
MVDNITTAYSFNTNNLPDDVLSYTDGKFYYFVEELLGQSAADLLKIQAINNIPSFLLSDDVCDIIELAVESEEIDALRKKISFAFRDGTYHVKIGIRNNFKYLNKLLSMKLEEENKKKRNPQKTTTKINSMSSSLATENNSASLPLTNTMNSTLPSLTTETNSPASPLTTINSTSPSLSTETNSTSPSLETKSYSEPPLLRKINSRTLPLTTKDEHIQFILSLVKKWTENSKENLHLDELELKPDVDYTISITDNNNVIDGAIKCRCGTRIRLRIRDGKFQITNFYKHLRSPTCFMMKEKIKQHNQQKQLSNNTSSNNNNSNTNDNQSTALSSITSQQPLSNMTINESTSQSLQTNIVSLSTTSGTKRYLSSLKTTNSPQSSAKKHKK